MNVMVDGFADRMSSVMLRSARRALFSVFTSLIARLETLVIWLMNPNAITIAIDISPSVTKSSITVNPLSSFTDRPLRT